MRILIVLVCLLLGGLPGAAGADLLLAERSNASPRHIQGPQKARINNQQAASRAKRRFPDSKILSIRLIRSDGPAVYRVKMLSERGVVKFIFVDGNNGEVFE